MPAGADVQRRRHADAGGGWSTWVQDGAIWKLESCPTGYYVSSTDASGDFQANQQRCQPCPQGQECTNASCVTCTLCQAGFFKSADGTGACEECSPFLYRTLATGASSQNDACQTCPKGARCANDECALRNADFNCSDDTSIVGAWVIDTSTGAYELTSCPAGYEMRTTAEGSAELQQCFKCQSPSTYILRPNEDDCQPCPPGLTCSGDDTLTPVVAGSTWVQEIDAGLGAIYRLEICLTGYYVSPTATETFVAAQQRCIPCADGTECVDETCNTCTACTPGKYKDCLLYTSDAADE